MWVVYEDNGMVESMALRWFHTPSTHPLNERKIFFLGFFSRPLFGTNFDLSFSYSLKRPTECFFSFFWWKKEKPARRLHTIYFSWCACNVPSVFVHVRISTGLVMCLSRCFNDKQREPMAEARSEMLQTFRHTLVSLFIASTINPPYIK